MSRLARVRAKLKNDEADQTHRSIEEPKMKIARLDSEVDGQRTTQLVAIGYDQADGGCPSFIGTVELLVFRPKPKQIAPRRSACIRMLFVHRAFRMEGIGRRLVEEACDIARLLGCETLGLALAADNHGGLLFYQCLGFQFAYEYDDGSMIVSKNLRDLADHES